MWTGYLPELPPKGFAHDSRECAFCVCVACTNTNTNTDEDTDTDADTDTPILRSSMTVGTFREQVERGTGTAVTAPYISHYRTSTSPNKSGTYTVPHPIISQVHVACDSSLTCAQMIRGVGLYRNNVNEGNADGCVMGLTFTGKLSQFSSLPPHKKAQAILDELRCNTHRHRHTPTQGQHARRIGKLESGRTTHNARGEDEEVKVSTRTRVMGWDEHQSESETGMVKGRKRTKRGKGRKKGDMAWLRVDSRTKRERASVCMGGWVVGYRIRCCVRLGFRYRYRCHTDVHMYVQCGPDAGDRRAHRSGGSVRAKSGERRARTRTREKE